MDTHGAAGGSSLLMGLFWFGCPVERSCVGSAVIGALVPVAGGVRSNGWLTWPWAATVGGDGGDDCLGDLTSDAMRCARSKGSLSLLLLTGRPRAGTGARVISGRAPAPEIVSAGADSHG